MGDQEKLNDEVAKQTLEKFTDSLRSVVAGDEDKSAPMMGVTLLALAKAESAEAPPPVEGEAIKVAAQFVDTGHLVYHNTDRAPTPTLTREEAMKKLLDYLGQSYMVVDGEIFDEAGVINRLADNLGTLVSNLDGTEEFALRILRAAKHPRFYFKGNALQRAKKYLARATSLINDFPWKYADDAPDEAVTDLRLAEALVQNAISALTGRGWERKIVPGAFNEDGALAAQKDEALRKPAPAIHVDVDTLKGRELSKKALEVAEQLEAMGDSPSTASVIGLNDPDLENPADTIPQAEYDALPRRSPPSTPSFPPTSRRSTTSP
jgi:hypothetical protein